MGLEVLEVAIILVLMEVILLSIVQPQMEVLKQVHITVEIQQVLAMEMLQALEVVLLELIVLEGLEELMGIMEDMLQEQVYQMAQLLVEAVEVLLLMAEMELLVTKEEMVE